MANSDYGFSTAGLAEIEQQIQREEALTGRPASKQRRKALYEAYLSSQAKTAEASNIQQRQMSLNEQIVSAQKEALKEQMKGNKVAGMIDIGKTVGKTGLEMYDRKLLPTQGGYTDKLLGIKDATTTPPVVPPNIASTTGIGTLSAGSGAGLASSGLSSGAGGTIGGGAGFSSSGLSAGTGLGASATNAGVIGGGTGFSSAGMVAGTSATGAGAGAGAGMGLGSMLGPAGWGMAGATGGRMLANALKVEDDATRAGMGIAGGAAAGAAAGSFIPVIGTAIGGVIGGAVGGVKEATNTVICTELHRQGILSDELYLADCKYVCQHIDTETYDGYYVWARHIAKGMAKSKLLTATVKPFAMAWAKRMAGEDNLLGDIILKIGVPVCRFIGTHMLVRETEVA